MTDTHSARFMIIVEYLEYLFSYRAYRRLSWHPVCRLRAFRRLGGDIPYHSGRDAHIGWSRIRVPSTHNSDSRIQHHVNGISIQFGHEQGGCCIETLIRQRKKEDKVEQSDNSWT